jgi:hypothetical protein
MSYYLFVMNKILIWVKIVGPNIIILELYHWSKKWMSYFKMTWFNGTHKITLSEVHHWSCSNMYGLKIPDETLIYPNTTNVRHIHVKLEMSRRGMSVSLHTNFMFHVNNVWWRMKEGMMIDWVQIFPKITYIMLKKFLLEKS